MTDPNTTPDEEQTATLLVDRTSSTCGGCGQPTLPSALTHANVSGYDPKPGGGCGARFVAIHSANRAVTEEHLRSMRPDLPVDTGQEQQTADRPYTDADLRAEAARQHAGLTEDPDFMGVGEQMQGQEVTPDGGVAWDDFRDETFEAARRSIHDLIAKAADTSRWAVDLGADGLEPHDRTLTSGGEQTGFRVHFAFNPGLTDSQRNAVINYVDHLISDCGDCPA